MLPEAALQSLHIEGLTADSRRVAPGYLFAALPGSRHDGREFIDEAVARGAVAVLCPSGTRLKDYDHPVALVTDANPRRCLALMAARFFDRQPRTIAAVTGTSGKSSVVEFTRQIWDRNGRRAASLGTLGVNPPLADAPLSLTTPDPVELHRCLAALAKDGVQCLAMEASSHGLDQYRLDGVAITAAAFTNLSRDHLDYHPDMETYLAAKLRLFTDLLSPQGTAVINADAPEAAVVRAAATARGAKLLHFGRAGEDLRLIAQQEDTEGQRLTLELLGRRYEVSLPLVGGFQASNVLAALGLTIASGVDPGAAVAVLPKLQGVPGRMERIGRTSSGGTVLVDYAHKPGALEIVLQTLRATTGGRLFVVFGCGGDRDAGKRPMMGEIADRLADEIIVTDDNPRSEDPAAIRRQILEAVPRAREIGDRGQAIAAAVAALGPGDVLVIAGKGHEAGQTIGGTVLPFDDRAVARTAIAQQAERAS